MIDEREQNIKAALERLQNLRDQHTELLGNHITNDIVRGKIAGIQLAIRIIIEETGVE